MALLLVARASFAGLKWSLEEPLDSVPDVKADLAAIQTLQGAATVKAKDATQREESGRGWLKTTLKQ